MPRHVPAATGGFDLTHMPKEYQEVMLRTLLDMEMASLTTKAGVQAISDNHVFGVLKASMTLDTAHRLLAAAAPYLTAAEDEQFAALQEDYLTQTHRVLVEGNRRIEQLTRAGMQPPPSRPKSRAERFAEWLEGLDS